MLTGVVAGVLGIIACAGEALNCPRSSTGLKGGSSYGTGHGGSGEKDGRELHDDDDFGI